MQWKRIQLNAWFTGPKGKRRFSTLAFWLLLSCSVVLLGLPCSSFAEDDLEPALASVDTLSPEGFDTLATLAVSLRSSGGGNITNDVAAILAWLQALTLTQYNQVATLPYGTSQVPLSSWIKVALGDGWTDSNQSKQKAYLYQIREKLNALPLADPSWTNLLDSISSDLSSTLLYVQDLDANSAELHYLVSIFTNQVAFADWIGSFEYGHGSEWGVHVNDSQWGDLLNALSSVSNAVGSSNTGMQDTWDDFYDVFTGIESYLSYIHYDDFEYYNTDRSVQQDFATLFDMMAAQSNAWSATASDYQTNDAMQASIQYEERQGQDAFEDQQDQDVEDTSDYLADHEPDYTARFTDNPMTPLVDAVDFSRRMRQDLPDVSDIETSSRVYLFKREWDPEHLLDRGSPSRASGAPITGTRLNDIYFDLSGSDPHVPNRLLSGATRMAAWAWNLAAMLLAYCMFRNFWDWVASWRA